VYRGFQTQSSNNVAPNSLPSSPRSRHYLKKFGKIHQIVLPKPGRTTYELANSYLPIARGPLPDCEINNLLPNHQLGNHQLGGRLGRSTTDALHYIDQHIKKESDIYSLCAPLDIQAGTSHKAYEYCNYVDMILTQRQIHFKFDDQISNPFTPGNGCCQGWSLSILLYAYIQRTSHSYN